MSASAVLQLDTTPPVVAFGEAEMDADSLRIPIALDEPSVREARLRLGTQIVPLTYEPDAGLLIGSPVAGRWRVEVDVQDAFGNATTRLREIGVSDGAMTAWSRSWVLVRELGRAALASSTRSVGAASSRRAGVGLATTRPAGVLRSRTSAA